MIQRTRSFFQRALKADGSATRVAMAVALGVYIAFSPFIGFHTLMVIASSWLFSLPFFVIFVVSSAINNPWTMAMVYGLDYAVGHYLCIWCGLDPLSLNPSWTHRMNETIFNLTGIKGVSFGAFMIGGNLLGIVLSVMLYPFVYKLLKHLHKN